jgi:hypothetical protein
VAVRQAKEHHVVACQHLGVRRLKHAIGQRQEVRVMLGE